MKTPISYYGGKQQLLATILPLIPEHRVYTESFFGGGAVFWAKPPAPVEVVNDANGNVVNFYRVLKTRYPQLKQAVEATMHSRETYKHACVIYALPWLFDDVTRAWAFWVATNMGFHHMVGSWTFDKIGKKARTIANKIAALTPECAERLQTVSVECKDASSVIAYYDAEDAFHYVDPPYLNCDQGHYGGYTEEHFKTLLKTLSTVKGKFLMSSYPHELLSAYVAECGWHQREIVMHLSASNKSGKKKVEVLTANYAI
jgi:DNA adenine methylase